MNAKSISLFLLLLIINTAHMQSMEKKIGPQKKIISAALREQYKHSLKSQDLALAGAITKKHKLDEFSYFATCPQDFLKLNHNNKK